MRVGQLIYGYCGGLFGRDSYGVKRIEALGYDWMVVRDSFNNEPEFLCTCDDLPIESTGVEKYTTEQAKQEYEQSGR